MTLDNDSLVIGYRSKYETKYTTYLGINRKNGLFAAMMIPHPPSGYLKKENDVNQPGQKKKKVEDEENEGEDSDEIEGEVEIERLEKGPMSHEYFSISSLLTEFNYEPKKVKRKRKKGKKGKRKKTMKRRKKKKKKKGPSKKSRPSTTSSLSSIKKSLQTSSVAKRNIKTSGGRTRNTRKKRRRRRRKRRKKETINNENKKEDESSIQEKGDVEGEVDIINIDDFKSADDLRNKVKKDIKRGEVINSLINKTETETETEEEDEEEEKESTTKTDKSSSNSAKLPKHNILSEEEIEKKLEEEERRERRIKFLEETFRKQFIIHFLDGRVNFEDLRNILWNLFCGGGKGVDDDDDNENNFEVEDDSEEEHLSSYLRNKNNLQSVHLKMFIGSVYDNEIYFFYNDEMATIFERIEEPGIYRIEEHETYKSGIFTDSEKLLMFEDQYLASKEESTTMTTATATTHNTQEILEEKKRMKDSVISEELRRVLEENERSEDFVSRIVSGLNYEMKDSRTFYSPDHHISELEGEKVRSYGFFGVSRKYRRKMDGEDEYDKDFDFFELKNNSNVDLLKKSDDLSNISPIRKKRRSRNRRRDRSKSPKSPTSPTRSISFDRRSWTSSSDYDNTSKKKKKKTKKKKKGDEDFFPPQHPNQQQQPTVLKDKRVDNLQKRILKRKNTIRKLIVETSSSLSLLREKHGHKRSNAGGGSSNIIVSSNNNNNHQKNSFIPEESLINDLLMLGGGSDDDDDVLEDEGQEEDEEFLETLERETKKIHKKILQNSRKLIFQQQQQLRKKSKKKGGKKSSTSTTTTNKDGSFLSSKSNKKKKKKNTKKKKKMQTGVMSSFRSGSFGSKMFNSAVASTTSGMDDYYYNLEVQYFQADYDRKSIGDENNRSKEQLLRKSELDLLASINKNIINNKTSTTNPYFEEERRRRREEDGVSSAQKFNSDGRLGKDTVRPSICMTQEFRMDGGYVGNTIVDHQNNSFPAFGGGEHHHHNGVFEGGSFLFPKEDQSHQHVRGVGGAFFNQKYLMEKIQRKIELKNTEERIRKRLKALKQRKKIKRRGSKSSKKNKKKKKNEKQENVDVDNDNVDEDRNKEKERKRKRMMVLAEKINFDGDEELKVLKKQKDRILKEMKEAEEKKSRLSFRIVKKYQKVRNK